MEMIYSKELGLTVLPETRTVTSDSFSLTDALALYAGLKLEILFPGVTGAVARTGSIWAEGGG